MTAMYKKFEVTGFSLDEEGDYNYPHITFTDVDSLEAFYEAIKSEEIVILIEVENDNLATLLETSMLRKKISEGQMYLMANHDDDEDGDDE